MPRVPPVAIADLPAGELQRLAARRDRAGAHDRRIDAGGRPGDDARKRLDAALLRLLRGHQHHRRRAVIDARRVASRDGAVLVEGGPQLGQRLHGRAVLRVFVVLNDDIALAPGDLNWNDLVLEAPGFLRRLGARLRAHGELILLLARDLPALCDVLCGVAHVIAVEGIPQAILDHGIDEIGIPHLDTVAQMDAVRRLAHALLPAGDDDRGIAVADRLIPERHGAQARAAKLVNAVSRHLIGDAGADC